MHSISGGLQTTVFGQPNTVIADLWTITLQSGTVLRYTDGDASVTFGGNTFAPFVLEGGDYEGALGAEVSSFELVLRPGTTTVGTLPMLTAARFGLFDRARVKVDRVFGSSYPTAPSESVIVFSGVVTNTHPASVSLTLTIKSLVALLDEPMPRRTVVAPCPFILGDSNCKVGLVPGTSPWVTDRTAAAGTTDAVLILNSSTSNAVVGSTVEILAGDYQGMRRLVRAVSGVNLTLDTPLPGTPATGNGIRITRGCAKTIPECTNTFANFNAAGGLRHGGMPGAPLPTSG